MDVDLMPPELSERIRVAQGVEHSEEENKRFADYVASTAFSISLSRNMVMTFLSLADAINKQHEMSRRPLHDGALTALERRGLVDIEWQPRNYADGVDRQRARWDQTASITTAGKLILQLLAEAGQAPHMLSPMPPPPPGWSDPRPKIEL